MQYEEHERARRAYRRVAREIMRANSLQPDSESRLSRVLKGSARDFVHDTGLIRLQDIDGIGPNRERKLATLGIWTPEDLHYEYSQGHLGELLALQKYDNGFTPSVLAGAIAASSRLPEEDLGSGFVSVEMLDGEVRDVPVERVFEIFEKEMEGEELSEKERQIDDMLTGNQRDRLMTRFKASNSPEGIRKTLEEAKENFEESGLEPEPLVDLSGKITRGRRVDEIKGYMAKFGVAPSVASVLTLEERGNYLTQEMRSRICSTAEHPTRCYTVGLEEVGEAGRRKKIRNTVLKLVKGDLRDEAENTVPDLLRRSSTLRKLGVDERELAELAEEMIEGGLLRTEAGEGGAGGGSLSKLYPTERVLRADLMSSAPVLVGKTSNPRIADRIEFLYRSPGEDAESYRARLMEKGGRAVLEGKSINRMRFNLKVPIRPGDDFEADAAGAVDILGYNTKTGFAPLGYEYRDRGVSERFNTFNVFVRPPDSAANRVFRPVSLVGGEDALTIAVENEGGEPIPDLGLTNIMGSDLGYITSLCPPSTNIEVDRNEAYAKSLAAAGDLIKQRKISGVTESGDGAMTAIYKLARKVDPARFNGAAERAWQVDGLGTKLKKILRSDVFATARNTPSGRKLGELAEEYAPLIEEMSSHEKKARELKMKGREEGDEGKYNRRRKVGCTISNIDKVPHEGRHLTLIGINRASQAGRDILGHLEAVCYGLEDEQCALDNIRVHQNLTEGTSGSYRDSALTSGIRGENMTGIDPEDLDKAFTFVAGKIFGSGGRLEGGRAEARRVLSELERGGYKTLDLGRWAFLEE